MSPSAEEHLSFLKEEESGATIPLSSKMTLGDEKRQQLQFRHQNDRMHELLARQLEYYFSTDNLSKDTYVSTLRSLNDGYVPLFIIAHFGKVQALAPYESALQAVQIAATDFSAFLEVVLVNSDTGKRVPKESNSPKTVVAIGPISGEPIPAEKIGSTNTTCLSTGAGTEAVKEVLLTPASTKDLAIALSRTPISRSCVRNTVILREAPDDVTEETIRELFAFEGCPPVSEAHLDLQSCW
jgi:hypothetical protein